MSSVDSDVTCPKCGFEEANESWSSHGYMHTFCGRCGYCREVDYQKGTDKTHGGAGSFRMTYGSGVARLGGIAEAESVRELKRIFRRAMRSLDVKCLEFNLLQNGVWNTVVVKDFPRPGPKKIQKQKPRGGSSAGEELVFEDMSDDIQF